MTLRQTVKVENDLRVKDLIVKNIDGAVIKQNLPTTDMLSFLIESNTLQKLHIAGAFLCILNREKKVSKKLALT